VSVIQLRASAEITGPSFLPCRRRERVPIALGFGGGDRDRLLSVWGGKSKSTYVFPESHHSTIYLSIERPLNASAISLRSAGRSPGRGAGVSRLAAGAWGGFPPHLGAPTARRFRRTLARDQNQRGGTNEMIFADRGGLVNISSDRLAFIQKHA
jgi:hypothetical protein